MNNKKHNVNIRYTTSTYWKKESILDILDEEIKFHSEELKKEKKHSDNSVEKLAYMQGYLQAFVDLRKNLNNVPCDEVDVVVYAKEKECCATCGNKEIEPGSYKFNCEGMEDEEGYIRELEVFPGDSCDSAYFPGDEEE